MATKTLPKDLEWTDLEVSEDYNIGLQLLTRGLPNYVSTRYRVSPVDIFSEAHSPSFINHSGVVKWWKVTIGVIFFSNKSFALFT